MATPQETLAKFQEISRRGIEDRLPPEVRARFDEAKRRGLIDGTKKLSIVPKRPPVAALQVRSLDDVTNGGVFLPKTDNGPTDDEIANEGRPPEPREVGQFEKVGGELASAFNRTVIGGIDFFTLDQVNNILELAGSDKRVPTLSEGAEAIGATQGGFMEPGLGRDVVQAAGTTLAAGMGLKGVSGRDLTKGVEAAKELAGFGGAITAPIKAAIEPVSSAAAEVAKPVKEAVADQFPSKAKQAAKLPLLRRSGDIAAAGFKLDEKGRVVKDKVQQLALKAGIDEAAVAMISSTDRATKARIGSMIDVLEKGRTNLEYRNFNPPQKVIGEAIDDRLKIIQKSNKKAAEGLEEAANSLKGQPVDVSAAVDTFLADLKKEGIKINLKTGKLDFSDSSIEGLGKAQNIIRTVFNRLYKTKDPSKNAYKAHLAKRFIDEQVTYGKTQAGMSGQMQGVIKRLRHNIDYALDSNFPEYDRVNTLYKETRDVIDEVQSLAGPMVDLTAGNTARALGTMSRKVLSNYASGQRMDTLFDTLDSVAKKYGEPLSGGIDDNLRQLVSMEAEIRKMFPTAIKPNTFQGEIGTEVGRGAANLAMGNKAGLFSQAVKAAGRAFSKSEEEKIEALKKLLAEKGPN